MHEELGKLNGYFERLGLAMRTWVNTDPLLSHKHMRPFTNSTCTPPRLRPHYPLALLWDFLILMLVHLRASVAPSLSISLNL